MKNLIEQRRKLRERFSKEITLEPEHVTITSADERFLRRAMDIVDKRMSDPDFNVEIFIREVSMSHMQLHRKLRALVNLSAVEFIRHLRLKRAAHLLQQQFGSISEVAFEVGFNSTSYFTVCFQKLFGQTPTEYLATIK